jgi:hypothetical protein
MEVVKETSRNQRVFGDELLQDGGVPVRLDEHGEMRKGEKRADKTPSLIQSERP